MSLLSCLLWGNSAGSGGNEIFIADPGFSSTFNHRCADCTGYCGQTGNITEKNCIHQDPQFVDAAGGDYHLQETSPCVDAGNSGLLPGGGNPRIATAWWTSALMRGSSVDNARFGLLKLALDPAATRAVGRGCFSVSDAVAALPPAPTAASLPRSQAPWTETPCSPAALQDGLCVFPPAAVPC